MKKHSLMVKLSILFLGITLFLFILLNKIATDTTRVIKLNSTDSANIPTPIYKKIRPKLV